MIDVLFEASYAATPLTADEKLGLIPSYITLRRELNEAEQINIAAAEQAAFARKRNVLDERYLRQLHRGMFRNVWKWAGALRKTPRNIGVEPWEIAEDLQRLIGDTQHWIEHKIFAPDEIAARFHHRLVWIHPFPNGNGRHARLATDLLLVALGRPPFSWGRTSLVDANENEDALRGGASGCGCP